MPTIIRLGFIILFDTRSGRIGSAVAQCSKCPGIESSDNTLDLQLAVSCASDAQGVLPCKWWEVGPQPWQFHVQVTLRGHCPVKGGK